MEPFNKDRYLQRQTAEDHAEIQRKTKEFLKNGGKVKKMPSSVSSGVCDLPPKQIRDIKKRLGVDYKRARKSHE